MTMPLTPVAARLPHFRREDDALFFLNSTRPAHRLDATERPLWDALDQDRALDDLTGTLGEDGRTALDRLTKAGVVMQAEGFQPGRRRILVIEPHSDDAALSIGATMWAQRHEIDFELVTLASRSNYTSSFQTGRDFFNRDRVTALRTEEGRLFMRALGGRYTALGLKEATLRYSDHDWPIAFFRGHRTPVAAWNNARAPGAVLDAWVEAVATCLAARDDVEEIWFPLGAGTHGDHDLTRNAMLIALSRLENPPRLRVYLDVPYGRTFPAHTDQLLAGIAARGGTLTEDFRALAPADFEEKLRLLGLFASQFKVASIRHGVEAAAGFRARGGAKLEHLWTLEGPLDTSDLAPLFHGQKEVEAVAPDLARWAAAPERVTRLRCLFLDAAGGWQDQLPRLRSAFPKADISVFAHAAVVAEIQEMSVDPKPRVTAVAPGSKAWGALALRLALAPPAHTIFVAGQRLDTARRLARLWPFGRTVVVAAMTSVQQALGERRAPD